MHAACTCSASIKQLDTATASQTLYKHTLSISALELLTPLNYQLTIRTFSRLALTFLCVFLMLHLYKYTLQRANSVTASPLLVRAFFDLCYRYLLYCPSGILQGPALRSIVEVIYTTTP
jgi:hypothetical protein